MKEVWVRLVDGFEFVTERLAIAAPPIPHLLTITLIILIPATLWTPTWHTLRHAATIIHEMGHATMATLWGRRTQGIKLHTDTSGVAITSGKPYGLGVIATFLAGYTAPPAAGYALIAAATNGWAGLAITLLVALLAAAFILIRNLWGFVTTALSLAAIGFIYWYGDATIIVTTVVAVGMFLIIAGVRCVVDLMMLHARKDVDTSTSDAAMLAHHTLVIPTIVWEVAFLAFALFCTAHATILVIGALTAA